MEMGLKLKGKTWNCNNQCGADCCSDLFLYLSPSQRVELENERNYTVPSNYTDFKWLKLHKGVKIEKMLGGNRKITPLKKYKIIFHPHLGTDMLYMVDKCSKLLPNGRCKIYRSRPEACRNADCILFTKNKIIRWYGETGVLKDWQGKRK